MAGVRMKFRQQFAASQFLADAAPQVRLMKLHDLAAAESHPQVAGIVPRILVLRIDLVGHLRGERQHVRVAKSRLGELAEACGAVERRHGNAEQNAELGRIRRRRAMLLVQWFPQPMDGSFATRYRISTMSAGVTPSSAMRSRSR